MQNPPKANSLFASQAISHFRVIYHPSVFTFIEGHQNWNQTSKEPLKTQIPCVRACEAKFSAKAFKPVYIQKAKRPQNHESLVSRPYLGPNALDLGPAAIGRKDIFKLWESKQEFCWWGMPLKAKKTRKESALLVMWLPSIPSVSVIQT